MPWDAGLSQAGHSPVPLFLDRYWRRRRGWEKKSLFQKPNTRSSSIAIFSSPHLSAEWPPGWYILKISSRNTIAHAQPGFNWSSPLCGGERMMGASAPAPLQNLVFVFLEIKRLHLLGRSCSVERSSSPLPSRLLVASTFRASLIHTHNGEQASGERRDKHRLHCAPRLTCIGTHGHGDSTPHPHFCHTSRRNTVGSRASRSPHWSEYCLLFGVAFEPPDTSTHAC